MSYLLDTCSISEMVAAQPNKSVLKWFERQAEENLYLSVITVGEISNGIYQLAIGKRRLQLEIWLKDVLLPTFQGRIFNIDGDLMTTWAKMVADFKNKGLIRPSFDSLIEATALRHNLILVTRNVKNFRGSPVTVLNPWEIGEIQ